MAVELRVGQEKRVPRFVAVCPECQSTLCVWSGEVDPAGKPVKSGLDVRCVNQFGGHNWSQAIWQPIIDKISAWAGAIE